MTKPGLHVNPRLSIRRCCQHHLSTPQIPIISASVRLCDLIRLRNRLTRRGFNGATHTTRGTTAVNPLHPARLHPLFCPHGTKVKLRRRILCSRLRYSTTMMSGRIGGALRWQLHQVHRVFAENRYHGGLQRLCPSGHYKSDCTNIGVEM